MKTTIVEQLQHRFTIREDDGTEFADALYFPVSAPPDDETLEAMRAERYANWKAAQASVRAPREPTKEDLEAELAQLQAERDAIDARLAERTATLEAVLLAEPVSAEVVKR